MPPKKFRIEYMQSSGIRVEGDWGTLSEALEDAKEALGKRGAQDVKIVYEFKS